MSTYYVQVEFKVIPWVISLVPTSMSLAEEEVRSAHVEEPSYHSFWANISIT